MKDLYLGPTKSINFNNDIISRKDVNYQSSDRCLNSSIMSSSF